jgi:hypothetical protein
VTLVLEVLSADRFFMMSPRPILAVSGGLKGLAEV